MSTPLEFLYHFRDLLREHGIRFAITSGMACVYYGLQQNTKDSDWIIEPADLPKLHELLARHERRVPPWRISYRQIFGAPLTQEYLEAGWTSHIVIQDNAGSVEHHLDWFGKPPRVKTWSVNEAGIAVRDVVAMMKRTDRDKDWPIVDGLGAQLAGQAQRVEALVHLQEAEALTALRREIPAEEFAAAAARRPLLRLLDEQVEGDHLTGWIRRERLIWECVNRERHSRYQRAWKDFYRRWRKEDEWDWPTAESFPFQHNRVCAAAERHGLPIDPLAEVSSEVMVESALARASVLGFVPVEQLQRICPPISEMLPRR